MKNYIWQIIILLILTSQYSCKKNVKEKHFKNVPKTIELTGDIPSFENKYGINPGEVFFYDSLIITSNTFSKTGEPYIYVLNRNTYKVLTTSGIRGKGPNELTNPIRMVLNKKKGLLGIWDVAKRKVFHFYIDSLLNNREYHTEFSIDIPQEVGMIYEAIAWGDTLVTGGGSGGALIQFIYNKGDTIEKIGKEHVVQKELSNRAFSKTLRKKMSVNYIHNKLILGYRYYDKISLINNKGEIVWSINGPDNIKPNFRGLSPYNSKVGYMWTCTGQDFIFGLYSGKPIGKYNEIGQFIPNYAEYIHVFNMEGNILGRFHLDRQVTSIVYDEANNNIIAQEAKTSNPFVIYNLPLSKFKQH